MIGNETTNDGTSTARGTQLTRRGFLAAAAVAGVATACSGSSSSSDGSTSEVSGANDTAADGSASGGSTPGSSANEFTLVQRFPNNVAVPGEQRLPITLSTGAAEFIQDGPATLTAQVVDADGAPIGGELSAVRRDVAPAPYYDFRTTIDEAGFYGLVIPGGPATGAAFQVLEPDAVAVTSPGELLTGFDTPTVGNEQAMASLCTRTPEPCPFHTISLSDALAVGRPVAYLIGSPHFCSTGSCGPGLDALIAAMDELGDAFVTIHVEVFTDDSGTQISPAVTAAGLTYEPALFLTDADGILVERLDAVWNQAELEERLALIV